MPIPCLPYLPGLSTYQANLTYQAYTRPILPTRSTPDLTDLTYKAYTSPTKHIRPIDGLPDLYQAYRGEHVSSCLLGPQLNILLQPLPTLIPTSQEHSQQDPTVKFQSFSRSRFDFSFRGSGSWKGSLGIIDMKIKKHKKKYFSKMKLNFL